MNAPRPPALAEAARLLLTEAQQGRHFPPALRGQLTLAEALHVQLAVRDAKVEAGDRQAGWKTALSSPRAQAGQPPAARAFGHIMAADVRASGAEVALGHGPLGLEPELCFTLGQTLRGPGVTPAQARAAVSAMSAAFELVQDRARGVADFPLNVAHNLSQWGLVLGEQAAAPPTGRALAAIRMQCERDGARVADSIGDAALIDDHFVSLSVLANTLAYYGEALAAGMRVITGAFSFHPLAPGQHWRAQFAGVGAVSVRTGR